MYFERWERKNSNRWLLNLKVNNFNFSITILCFEHSYSGQHNMYRQCVSVICDRTRPTTKSQWLILKFIYNSSRISLWLFIVFHELLNVHATFSHPSSFINWIKIIIFHCFEYPKNNKTILSASCIDFNMDVFKLRCMIMTYKGFINQSGNMCIVFWYFFPRLLLLRFLNNDFQMIPERLPWSTTIWFTMMIPYFQTIGYNKNLLKPWQPS